MPRFSAAWMAGESRLQALEGFVVAFLDFGEDGVEIRRATVA